MLKKFSFLTVILLSIFIIFSFQKSIADEKDEAAIKKVIKNETKYFFDCNQEEFSKTWVNEPYTLWTSIGSNWYTEYVGWDSIWHYLKGSMEKLNLPPDFQVIRENFTYRIFGY